MSSIPFLCTPRWWAEWNAAWHIHVSQGLGGSHTSSALFVISFFFFLFNEITAYLWICWKIQISFPLFAPLPFCLAATLNWFTAAVCLLSFPSWFLFFGSPKYTLHLMTFCSELKKFTYSSLHLLYPTLSESQTGLFPPTHGFALWLYFIIFLHSFPTSRFSMLLHFIHTLPPPYVDLSSCHFSTAEANSALPLQELWPKISDKAVLVRQYIFSFCILVFHLVTAAITSSNTMTISRNKRLLIEVWNSRPVFLLPFFCLSLLS